MPRYVPKDEAKRRRKLYDKGLSDSAIGRELGIKRDCVTKWRTSIGLPSRFSMNIPREALAKRVDQVDQEVRKRLHAEGLSDKDIGRKIGVSPSTIRSWRRRHKLSADHRGGRITCEENAARMLLYQLGWSDRQIAKQRGVHLSSIWEWRVRRHMPPGSPKGHVVSERDNLRTFARRVRKAVGFSLPVDIADDTAGELYLAVLSGSLKLEDLEKEARRFGSRTLERFANRYGPRSIDEEIGEDGFTLLDTMPDASQSSWLEEMGATVW